MAVMWGGVNEWFGSGGERWDFPTRRLADRFSGATFARMGQQLKARIKRRRRQDYLERKKIAAKTPGVAVAKPKTKPAAKPKAAKAAKKDS